MTKKIFLSWQSDTGGNKAYLTELLERFVQENPEYTLEAADRDPDGDDKIDEIILEKIELSNYLVADISVINPEDAGVKGKRLTCNPNVLYELGYAKGLKKVRCILVCNRATVEQTKELPFDIRNRRIVHYKFDSRNKKKIYSDLDYALKRKKIVASDVIKEIVYGVVKAKTDINNLEYLLTNVSHETLVGQFNYFRDFVTKQVPVYRRSLAEYPLLVSAVEDYLKEVKSFSKLYASLGLDSHNERKAALESIDKGLDKVIQLLKEYKLVKFTDLSEAEADYFESLRDWLAQLDTDSNISLESFYKFSEGINLYMRKLIYMDADDANLKSIADNLQEMTSKHFHWSELEGAKAGLLDLISAREQAQ
jgi:hypothetical protein